MRKEMRLASLAGSLVLSGAIFLGCDKKDETAAPPAAAPASGNTVTNTVSNATDAVSNAAKSAENSASNAISSEKDKASSELASATDAAKQKLAQVEGYIGQKKLDLADGALKEVEGVKGSLPQALQDQVAALRTKLDAAKASASNLPAVPGAGN